MILGLQHLRGRDVPQRGDQNHLLALESGAGLPPVAPTLAKDDLFGVLSLAGTRFSARMF